MKVDVFKDKAVESLGNWLKSRVDDMATENPLLALPATYIKRGCNNIVDRYRGKIAKSIDYASLFFANEEGEINVDTLFADIMEMLRTMEESPFKAGILNGSIGKGKLAIALPDNFLTSMVFGNKKTIVLCEKDFAELKDLLTTE